MRRIAAGWRRHPWLVSGFLIAFALTLFFAVRMVAFTIYWSDPVHRDHALAAWMTPGYIAKSWDVPRDIMQDALGPLAAPGDRKTLKMIAEQSGVPLAELTARIEAAITAHRAQP